MFTATISTLGSNGYESDVKVIRFDRNGKVNFPQNRPDLAPTDDEQDSIIDEVTYVQFPHMMRLNELSNSNMSPMMKAASDEDMFIFRDRSGRIEFVQVRIATPDGDKRYVPQTYWSDGEWRKIEPEDGLPLYNGHLVTKGCRLFLHEGAKAGRAGHRISQNEDHPYYDYFKTGVHVGWCGGASFVWKNRFTDIMDLPSEVIIVPDNDNEGRAAIPAISKIFAGKRTLKLEVPYEWKQGWDFADEPESYIDLRRQIKDSCWATREYHIEGERNPRYEIQKEFGKGWLWVHELSRLVSRRDPTRMMNREQFNMAFGSMSHVADLWPLMSKSSWVEQVSRLSFLPERSSGIIESEGEEVLNTYVDLRATPRAGDTSIFHQFMEYLFSDEKERYHMWRWIATLYARPDIRMTHAVLMMSTKQGVGKSTLMDILRDLIGRAQTSAPGEDAINDRFNDWITDKRLVCIHEIYSGHSFTVYNKMKSLITEEVITSNRKHMAAYTTALRAAIIAASNSATPLKIDVGDRRWFLPTMPSDRWEEEKYERLAEWRKSNGIGALAKELLSWNHFISGGENAPESDLKRFTAISSLDPEIVELCDLIEAMKPNECLQFRDVYQHVGRKYRDRLRYFNIATVRSFSESLGFFVHNHMAGQMATIWKTKESFDAALAEFGKAKLIPACLTRSISLVERAEMDAERM